MIKSVELDLLDINDVTVRETEVFFRQFVWNKVISETEETTIEAHTFWTRDMQEDEPLYEHWDSSKIEFDDAFDTSPDEKEYIQVFIRSKMKKDGIVDENPYHG